MNIGIDIDDTIADTSKETAIFAKEYTENVLKREFKIYDFQTSEPVFIRSLYGWSSEEDNNFWDLYYEPIIDNVNPKPNAVETINKLYENHNIFIISARWDNENKTILPKTESWLNKNNIHFNKLIIGNWDKRISVKENNIDLFIDDTIKTCSQISKLGIKTLVMTNCVNKNIDIPDLERVDSWKDIERKIEQSGVL